jgi:hypothetical protein
MEREAREEAQERAKRLAHEQLKRETQQTLARQMTERDAARQQQIRQMQDEAREHAERLTRFQVWFAAQSESILA